ncbi:MAG: hypothetical protein HY788_19640 [Deltaproteobacteria bacterium]|nr:hypothetical protein [Deltaproteobacteria bacterium]
MDTDMVTAMDTTTISAMDIATGAIIMEIMTAIMEAMTDIIRIGIMTGMTTGAGGDDRPLW